MSNIVVLVKQVPDTYSERKLTDDDFTLDRESADAVLDEINENAVEAALQLKEAGGDYNIVVLSVGPASAQGRTAQGALARCRRGHPRHRRRPRRLRCPGHRLDPVQCTEPGR